MKHATWDELGLDEPVPDSIGLIDGEPGQAAVLTQLILLYHLIHARQSVAGE